MSETDIAASNRLDEQKANSDICFHSWIWGLAAPSTVTTLIVRRGQIILDQAKGSATLASSAWDHDDDAAANISILHAVRRINWDSIHPLAQPY